MQRLWDSLKSGQAQAGEGAALRGTGLFPAACAIPFVSILQFPGSLMPLAFPHCLLHSWGKCHQVGGGHTPAQVATGKQVTQVAAACHVPARPC